MDLKEYAILAKLNTDSDLLSKVMKGDPLSIDQVSHYFAPLLAPVPADGIDKLISDYPSYLASHTKLALEQLEGHQVKIDGEIDDRTLEVVKLLSGDNTKTIIENVIKANFENFSSSSVAIDTIKTSLSEDATKSVYGPKTYEEFEKEQENEKNASKAFLKTKPALGVDASASVGKTEETEEKTEKAKSKATEAEASKAEKTEESKVEDTKTDMSGLTAEDIANITGNVVGSEEDAAENSETEVDKQDKAEETKTEANEEAKTSDTEANEETKTEGKTEKTKQANEEADEEANKQVEQLTEAQAKAKQNRENADYDMRLAEKIKEAMQFLLEQLEENDLDKKLPGLNLKGLENPQASLAH